MPRAAVTKEVCVFGDLLCCKKCVTERFMKPQMALKVLTANGKNDGVDDYAVLKEGHKPFGDTLLTTKEVSENALSALGPGFAANGFATLVADHVLLQSLAHGRREGAVKTVADERCFFLRTLRR